jgi:arsenate reductase-like glutaredoxin family protein
MRKGADSRVTAETPDDEVIRQMVADPNLIQRPIVEVGNRAVMARPIGKALDLIK